MVKKVVETIVEITESLNDPNEILYLVEEGPQGPKGEQGIPGVMGIAGPVGPVGPMGQGIELAGNVVDYSQLPSGLDPEDSGSAYLNSADGKLYVWNGSAFPVEGQGTDFRGPMGPQGIQGIEGIQGPIGPQGIRGETGIQGPVGPTGPIGLQGIQGIKGDKGDTGNPGIQGPQGLIGPIGDTGPQGPEGEQGIQGDTGLTGPKGDKGDVGDTGPIGPIGLTGPIGPQGDVGAGLELSGQVDDHSELPTGLTEADAGKSYLNTADGKLYIWSGTAFPADGAGTLFRGPRGTSWFLGTGVPVSVPGAVTGDMYLDTDTGIVYLLEV